MKHPLVLLALIAVLLTELVGCVSTPVRDGLPVDSAAAAQYWLADQWTRPGVKKKQFDKLLVIGITSDQEARHNFENKFVSHLRGRRIDGVTSHSLVADLAVIENPDEIVTTLVEQKVNGVITVRLMPLNDLQEEEWKSGWQSFLDENPTVRLLIERSLPLSGGGAKKYGAEIALWDMETRRCIWTARTDAYTMKKMRKAAGGLVQRSMDALKIQNLM